MNKQTAIELLQVYYDNQPACEEFITPEDFEKFKQIEKEYMFDFAKKYADYIWERSDSTDITRPDILKPYTPEEYYNETYGKK
jgi:hypothetical protein